MAAYRVPYLVSDASRKAFFRTDHSRVQKLHYPRRPLSNQQIELQTSSHSQPVSDLLVDSPSRLLSDATLPTVINALEPGQWRHALEISARCRASGVQLGESMRRALRFVTVKKDIAPAWGAATSPQDIHDSARAFSAQGNWTTALWCLARLVDIDAATPGMTQYAPQHEASARMDAMARQQRLRCFGALHPPLVYPTLTYRRSPSWMRWSSAAAVTAPYSV
eukprot:PhM_4_TR10430/c0_g1_i6/m.48017